MNKILVRYKEYPHNLFFDEYGYVDANDLIPCGSVEGQELETWADEEDEPILADGYILVCALDKPTYQLASDTPRGEWYYVHKNNIRNLTEAEWEALDE